MKQAIFETSKGTIRLELFEEKTPKTVGNFETLCGKEYYDGLTFHRVIADFMIQGGCPDGTGMGGPGYKFEDEFDPELRHDAPGVLSRRMPARIPMVPSFSLPMFLARTLMIVTASLVKYLKAKRLLTQSSRATR